MRLWIGKNHITYICVALLSGSGCTDSFMKSDPRKKTSALSNLTGSVDAAGNVSAAFDPSSGTVQVLSLTSGALAGAGLAMPPGALSIAVNITVGEGETLASSGFTQQLGLSSNTVSAAGPSVSFIPSSNIQANSPFTLSLPVSGTSLALSSADNDNLVVLYRWMKVENGVVSYVMGIIPRDDVTISGSKVSFQTTKFGVFQVGVSETKITESVSVPTVEPPTLKADASNPLVGTWTQCHVDGSGSTGGGGTQDWTSGNTYQFTSGLCTTGLSVSMLAQITNVSGPFYIGASINGAAADAAYSLPINSSTASPMQVFNVSGTQYQTIGLPAIITLWAPSGCRFSDGINSFMALSLNSATNPSPTCSYSASGVTLLCDGTDPYGGGGGQGGGGDMKFGIVPGVTYSSYDVGKFTSSTFTHIQQRFESADCTGTLVGTMTETGSYSLPDVDVSGTIPINLSKSTKVGTLFDADSVSAANSDPDYNGCGFTDWVVGTQKDLFSSSCAGTTTTEYTRMKMDGTKLYFCHQDDTANNGTTEALRPTNCDSIRADEYLEKQ